MGFCLDPSGETISFSFLSASFFQASWWMQHIKLQVSLLPQYSKEISWSPPTGWGSLLLMLAHFSGPFCMPPSQSNSFCKQMNFPTLSGLITTQGTMKFMVSMVIQSHVTHITIQGVHPDTALCGNRWCEKTENGNIKLTFNPSPGDLPDPGIKPRSPSVQPGSLPTEPPGKLNNLKAQLNWLPFNDALLYFLKHD